MNIDHILENWDMLDNTDKLYTTIVHRFMFKKAQEVAIIVLDLRLISEAGEIMKIYFVTYNTPVIDLGQYQGLGPIYFSIQSIIGTYQF